MSDQEQHSSIPVVTDSKELVRRGIVKVPLPQEMDALRWAHELSQVTPMNMSLEGDGEYAFYRNILDEPEFPFDSVLQSEIGKAILKYFDIQQLSEIRLDDAFCISYNEDQLDTSGAKHTDPSDITVNICLEKTPDVQGSHVLFYGTKVLRNVHDDVVASSDLRFLVNQEAGFATIHFGDHPHQTTSLTKGRRTNIVLTYCFADPAKSDVTMRTCYT